MTEGAATGWVRGSRWVPGCAAAVAVALIGGGLALAYLDRHLVPASLTGWTFSNVSSEVVDVAVPVTGYVIASRRPENRIGWLFLVAGLGLGVIGFANQYALHALYAPRESWPVGLAFAWLTNWTWVIPIAMLAFLFLLFPTGYLRSRRWRLAAWFTGGAFALTSLLLLIAATRLWTHPFTPATHVHGLTAVLYTTSGILISAAVLVSVAALVVRFARSAGEERLQLKWCATAALVLAVEFVAAIWVNSAFLNVLQSLAFVCLWAAIAIAILKYRLYAIDRIISRTLAYAIVTGLLVGVYAGLVLLATQVFRFHAPVAVAASTLAAAALFNPLRWRVQQVVDRRFNRARYNADQTVAAFAARLKDTVNLDSVRDDLATVVDQTLEPAHVSVWISQGRGLPVRGGWYGRGGVQVAVHQGDDGRAFADRGSDPAEEDCDGLSLMWRLHQHAIPARLPSQRTVVHLTLTGAGAADGWLDIQRGAVTVCKDDPGYDVDLAIEADTGQMQRWLVGLIPFRDLIANGHARLLGPSRLARAFPTWFDTTYFAEGLRRAGQRRRRQAVPA